MLPVYPSHQAVGSVVLPAGQTRLIDFGLSAALMIWTEELLAGDVENWHRYAVEINTLRNDLRDADMGITDQSAVSVSVRTGTWAGLVAAAISCAGQGPRFTDAQRALHELAVRAERAILCLSGPSPEIASANHVVTASGTLTTAETASVKLTGVVPAAASEPEVASDATSPAVMPMTTAPRVAGATELC